MIRSFREFARKHYLQIDERSLGLFRISISLTLVEDWVRRWIDRADFLAPDGVLPASLSGGFSIFNGVNAGWQLDLLMLSGLLIYILFALGYRTRLFHFLAFAFQVMMCHRNEWINNAGEVIASCFLFWTWFLPTGARFSLDSRAGRGRGTGYSVLAPVAVYLQIAVIYFASALSKTGPSWADGTALYYFWNLTFGSDLGVLLSRYTPLFVIERLSFAAFLCEIAAPFLILLPVRRWPLRRVALLLLIGMHLGIDLTFFTGVFQYIAISSLFLLISEDDWKLLPFSGIRSRPVDQRGARAPRGIPGFLADSWVIFFMALCGYHAFSEALNYRYGAGTVSRAPEWAERLLTKLQIPQVWRMYAPQPATVARWWVMQGTFRDGSTRDLLTGGPVDFNRPMDVGGRQSRFWTRYIFVLPYVPSLVGPFLDYLEARHAAEGVMRIDLFYLEQATPPPGFDLSNSPRIFDLASRELATRRETRMQIDHRVDWKWEGLQ